MRNVCNIWDDGHRWQSVDPQSQHPPAGRPESSVLIDAGWELIILVGVCARVCVCVYKVSPCPSFPPSCVISTCRYTGVSVPAPDRRFSLNYLRSVNLEAVSVCLRACVCVWVRACMCFNLFLCVQPDTFKRERLPNRSATEPPNAPPPAPFSPSLWSGAGLAHGHIYFYILWNWTSNSLKVRLCVLMEEMRKERWGGGGEGGGACLYTIHTRPCKIELF